MVNMNIAWLMSVAVFSVELSSHSFIIFQLISNTSNIVNKMEHFTQNLSYPLHIFYAESLLNSNKGVRIKQLKVVATIVLQKLYYAGLNKIK